MSQFQFDQRFCVNCRHAVEKDSETCTNCGKPPFVRSTGIREDENPANVVPSSSWLKGKLFLDFNDDAQGQIQRRKHRTWAGQIIGLILISHALFGLLSPYGYSGPLSLMPGSEFSRLILVFVEFISGATLAFTASILRHNLDVLLIQMNTLQD